MKHLLQSSETMQPLPENLYYFDPNGRDYPLLYCFRQYETQPVYSVGWLWFWILFYRSLYTHRFFIPFFQLSLLCNPATTINIFFNLNKSRCSGGVLIAIHFCPPGMATVSHFFQIPSQDKINKKHGMVKNEGKYLYFVFP